jgi:hypothetical protein
VIVGFYQGGQVLDKFERATFWHTAVVCLAGYQLFNRLIATKVIRPHFKLGVDLFCAA